MFIPSKQGERTEEEQEQNNPVEKPPFGTDDDDHKTDRILADEILRLSIRERTNIHEEIHGVRDAFPAAKETPETLKSALSHLKNEVDAILSEDASGLRSEHVPQNRALHLAFLRCEHFDVRKAARRLVAYVRVVRSLSASGRGVGECFSEPLGGNNGGRIRAKVWFTKDEYAALEKGVIQLAPFRDRSGRRVLVVWSPCFRLPIVTRMKIVLYLVSAASEDVESQKKGMVVMIWPGKCPSVKLSKEGIWNTLKNRHVANDVQVALPLRMVCFHFGYESSPLLRFAKNMMIQTLEAKTRFNIITGTITELNYKIMGYGIHPSMLPVAANGVIKNKSHVQWIEGRERIEQEPYGSPLCDDSTGNSATDCPGVRDVLFQRGKSCQYHPGNATFRNMLESRKDRHRKANQTAKREIGWEIVMEIESRSGRFLRWDPQSGWWVEFTDRTEIRHKVATSLRDFDKYSRARSNRQNQKSRDGIDSGGTESGYLFVDHSAEQRRKRRRTSSLSGDDSSDCSCNCLKLP